MRRIGPAMVHVAVTSDLGDLISGRIENADAEAVNVGNKQPIESVDAKSRSLAVAISAIVAAPNRYQAAAMEPLRTDQADRLFTATETADELAAGGRFDGAA